MRLIGGTVELFLCLMHPSEAVLWRFSWSLGGSFVVIFFSCWCLFFILEVPVTIAPASGDSLAVFLHLVVH